MSNKIEIHVDGSSSGNPGPSGFGVTLNNKGVITNFSKGYRRSTNNRMELMAMCYALSTILSNTQLLSEKVEIISDSKYVVDGMNKWMHNWNKKNFVGVKNPDLWRYAYNNKIKLTNVTVSWVKGHADNPGNILADQLAVNAMLTDSTNIDRGYEQGA